MAKMNKSNISAKMVMGAAGVPEGATLVCDKAVIDDDHPIGAALIRWDASGLYSMLNAGVVSNCDQAEAREIGGKYKVQARWDAANTVQVKLKLCKSTDADILAKLAEVDSKQGYIKELIRADLNKKQG